MPLQRSGFFDHFEGFDNIADLDVVEVFEADAALVALEDFADVVLEAAERGNLAVVHNHAVAEQTDAGVTGELAVDDMAARDGADLRHGEDFAHFGLAEVHLAADGSEQTGLALLISSTSL